MECSVTISIMGQTIIKRNKTFPKKIQLHKANEMLHEFILSMNLSHWFWTTMKIVPCIVNNHNNTFTKTKKLCFQLENKEKSMGPTFSEEVVNRGRCFSSYHQRGTKEKKSESSWGIEPMETQNFFLCPMLVTRRKTSSSISLPSSKLTTSGLLYLRSNQCLQVT